MHVKLKPSGHATDDIEVLIVLSSSFILIGAIHSHFGMNGFFRGLLSSVLDIEKRLDQKGNAAEARTTQFLENTSFAASVLSLA